MEIVYRQDQKEIMTYKAGTMGIQAVPGAGKTFIITNLVADLLEDMIENDRDGKILVLTYMNSAVNNFKSRIRSILDEKGLSKTKFEVMTIHSLAMKIIKENSSLALINEEFEIIDDYKKEMLLKNVIEKFREEDTNQSIDKFIDPSKQKNEKIAKIWNREFFNIVSNSIKLLKYENLTDESLKVLVEHRKEELKNTKNKVERNKFRGIMNIISPIYSLYQEELRNNAYMDYDDILIIAYNILSKDEAVARHYQKRYRYVFEDECQDSNMLQGKIIDIISGNKNNKKKSGKNLVRVGDVNQSITGTFTGSDPKYFIDFCKNADYKYNMNMASRSSQDIIGLANELVVFTHNNKNQAYYNSLEELYIEEVEKAKGYKENPKAQKNMLKSLTSYSIEDETNHIIKEIEYIQKNFPSYSIGILSFYNNSISRLADSLKERLIECEELGANLNERKKIITDVKLAIDFLIDPKDDNKLLELIFEAFIIRNEELEIDDDEAININKYFKGVDCERWIFDDEYYREYKNKSSSTEELIIKELSEVDVFKIRTNMGSIRSSIQKLCSFPQIDIAKLVENIINLFPSSREEKMLGSYIAFYLNNLLKFESEGLSRASVALDIKYSRVFDAAIESIYDIGEYKAEPGSITLATLHKSKGMEWDAVIMFGLDSDNFPSQFSDYFRMDRKYLRDGFRCPEASVEKDIDYFSKNEVKEVEEYEMILKKDTIAEHVRLMYVGITRAKKRILMMNCRKQMSPTGQFTFNKKDSVFFAHLSKYISKNI
ncbi:MAG: ATP-dependent helicase [Peptostreptococcus sp.]|uniref:ATP-dependent helicase n=1 Tax=Peptostreptococcus sp. TaxID=1262 RepID=UPI002FC9AFF8